ncbi:hypothetical protein QOT17_019362 [Balamuthia mandrillaris]
MKFVIYTLWNTWRRRLKNHKQRRTIIIFQIHKVSALTLPVAHEEPRVLSNFHAFLTELHAAGNNDPRHWQRESTHFVDLALDNKELHYLRCVSFLPCLCSNILLIYDDSLASLTLSLPSPKPCRSKGNEVRPKGKRLSLVTGFCSGLLGSPRLGVASHLRVAQQALLFVQGLKVKDERSGHGPVAHQRREQ